MDRRKAISMTVLGLIPTISSGNTLKSIGEHNEERDKIYENFGKPIPLGIACPEECCGYELYNTRPFEVLTSMPPSQRAECLECGYITYVRL